MAARRRKHRRRPVEDGGAFGSGLSHSSLPHLSERSLRATGLGLVGARQSAAGTRVRLTFLPMLMGRIFNRMASRNAWSGARNRGQDTGTGGDAGGCGWDIGIVVVATVGVTQSPPNDPTPPTETTDREGPMGGGNTGAGARAGLGLWAQIGKAGETPA